MKKIHTKILISMIAVGLLAGCTPGPVRLGGGSSSQPVAVKDSQGNVQYVKASYKVKRKNIVYVPKSAIGSDLISQKILAAYAKDPVLSQYSLGVTTHRGEVTLTGTVPDKSTRNYAVKMARYTKGVLMVHNNITITQ